jgi:prepilin-type N-terminal cleavage/methylation domain-containing protein
MTMPKRRLRAFAGSAGFSLLEMLVVVSILLIVAAVAIPTFIRISYNIRLKSAVSNVSGLMQQTRILAAKQNAVYTVAYRAATTVEEAYIDLNGNGQLDSGEPVIDFPASVTPASGAPSGTGGQPSAYVLVGDTGTTNYDNATTLGFSARGLPCAYSGGTCATPSAGYFVYYFRDSRPNGTQGWGAVVVTRTGRTKTTVWNGASWD